MGKDKLRVRWADEHFPEQKDVQGIAISSMLLGYERILKIIYEMQHKLMHQAVTRTPSSFSVNRTSCVGTRGVRTAAGREVVDDVVKGYCNVNIVKLDLKINLRVVYVLAAPSSVSFTTTLILRSITPMPNPAIIGLATLNLLIYEIELVDYIDVVVEGVTIDTEIGKQTCCPFYVKKEETLAAKRGRQCSGNPQAQPCF
ncbi:hypothetical protein Ancab_005225 [Ancistrocladus abbreviatus]